MELCVLTIWTKNEFSGQRKSFWTALDFYHAEVGTESFFGQLLTSSKHYNCTIVLFQKHMKLISSGQ